MAAGSISELAPKGGLKRALVLRTARDEQLNACISAIKDEFPFCNVTVAAQKQWADAAAGNPLVDSVIVMPASPVRPWSFPLREVLLNGKYDAVVVLYNDVAGGEYFHADTVAALIPARARFAFDPHGEFRPLGSAPDGSALPFSATLQKTWLGAYTRPIDKKIMLALARTAEQVRGAPKPPGEAPPGGWRVCHTISNLDLGGCQRHLAYVVRHRSQQFHDTHVLCLPSREKFFEEEIVSSGARVHYLYEQPPSAPRFSDITLRLYREIRSLRPHVLFNWAFDFSLCGAVAGALARVPVIVEAVQNTSSYVEEVWMPANDPSNIPFIEAVKTAARISSVSMANADFLRSDYESWAGLPPGRVVTVHNGIPTGAFDTTGCRETERASLGIPPAARVAGIVGRIAREKDHETFFRMAADVAREMPDALFLVAGYLPEDEDADPAARFAGLLSELGIARNVIFTGKTTRVREVLSCMDVAVSSSIVEGFPNTVLEEMAAGLPVVTTDAGGCAEAVAHGVNGFVAPVGDHEALAAGVLSLMRNPGLAAQMGAAGKKRAHDEFDVKKMVRATEDVLLGLLGA